MDKGMRFGIIQHSSLHDSPKDAIATELAPICDFSFGGAALRRRIFRLYGKDGLCEYGPNVRAVASRGPER